jgi:hypothetical protein
MTLHAEWDMNFAFVHVLKSHQDDDTPTAGLTLKSRLNVEAERLATEYMQEDPICRPHAALFLSAKAQLLIKLSSATRKIPQAIRMEAGSIVIQGYLLKCNLWTENTLNDIHWDAPWGKPFAPPAAMVLPCKAMPPAPTSRANTPSSQHQIPTYLPRMLHQTRITKPFHPMRGTNPNHLAYCTSHKTPNTDEQNEHS